jgi:DNA repair protein RecN (Recombination protein N)
VLEELRVENLLLIERAELRLGPGLNVLTGETGAGKTVLAHALDLLLGGKPRSGIVRPGANEAYVEGVFSLPDELRARLGDRLPEDAEDVVLARRVGAEGRTRAYLAGRSATAADLQEVGGALLSFYGQHEHRKLTLASAQLEILDGFCGPKQAQRRQAFAETHAREREVRRRLEELHARAGARERELDLLVWELEEIERAAPSEQEEAELAAERERLRHLEALTGAASHGVEALNGESGEGAAAALAGAARALEGVRGVDAELDTLIDRVNALAVEADDLAAELRRYGEGIDAPPGRLDEVEERLALLDRLKRKHGGTLAAVLEHAEACRRRRDELTGAEEALEAAEAELREARAAMAAQGEQLRSARRKAATGLAKAVKQRLAALAMDGATFEAALTPREEPGPSGADEVEFLIAPNPGVPAGPLRETASGGELSRVMLALMGVAAEAGPGTLVFDEVDAGIGGQTARAVGEQLRELASGRQVICITHLPQIASLAERHFTIVKDVTGKTARTTVSRLERAELVGELVRMLGADHEDAAARRHATELLKAA